MKVKEIDGKNHTELVIEYRDGTFTDILYNKQPERRQWDRINITLELNTYGERAAKELAELIKTQREQ